MTQYRSSRKNVDKAIGIAAIIVGLLVLLGQLSFGWVVPILGAVLVVAGILMFVHALPGGNLMATAFVVIGALLLLNVFGIPNAIAAALDIVLGIALIVVGIMKLM